MTGPQAGRIDILEHFYMLENGEIDGSLSLTGMTLMKSSMSLAAGVPGEAPDPGRNSRSPRSLVSVFKVGSSLGFLFLFSRTPCP